jgi:Bacterial sugar transferase
MVRPGLTGWAQVNGGALLSAEEKELDAWYVRHASPRLDLKIVGCRLAPAPRDDRTCPRLKILNGLTPYERICQHGQNSQTDSPLIQPIKCRD